jgi:hypothetical protein
VIHNISSNGEKTDKRQGGGEDLPMLVGWRFARTPAIIYTNVVFLAGFVQRKRKKKLQVENKNRAFARK